MVRDVILALLFFFLMPHIQAKSFFPGLKKIRKKVNAVVRHAKKVSGDQKPTAGQFIGSALAVSMQKRSSQERALDELLDKRDSLYWVSNSDDIKKVYDKLQSSNDNLVASSIVPFLFKSLIAKTSDDGNGMSILLSDKRQLDCIISDMVSLIAQVKKQKSSSVLKKRIKEELYKSIELKTKLVSMIKLLDETLKET